jgi:hypothetical protein
MLKVGDRVKVVELYWPQTGQCGIITEIKPTEHSEDGYSAKVLFDDGSSADYWWYKRLELVKPAKTEPLPLPG